MRGAGAVAAAVMEAAMEPGEEVEDEEEQRVPPIATTPPRRSWREESLSQSSSETLVSATSGISLGEAIRQRTAAHQEIDSWYQLPAEVDASRLTAASETTLGLASDRNDLSEFPTLEEGMLPSAETSRMQHPEDTVHGLLLDIQDSQFTPCLPLLTYSTPGQRILDETLFQQSERDFIHLRGVPDVSGASEQHSDPLHIPGAAWLTDVETPSDAPSGSCSLSQHPLSFGQTEPCDANYLSQQASRFSEQLLTNKEASEDCKTGTNEKALIPQMGDKAMNQMEAALAKQTYGTSVEDERFTCDNNVLTPVFELSEKEKELSGHDEFSSSENSSCKTALTKNSGKSEREMQMERVKMAGSESAGCLRHPERMEKEGAPELGSSKTLSDDLKKSSCKNSGARDVFSAKTSEITGESKECQVDLNGFGSMKFVAVTNELRGAFLEKQGLREQELSPIVPSTGDSAPKQLVMTDMESPPSCSGNARVEVEPGVHKAELTISDVSIERGHKVTGISPSLNFIVDDGSFFRHFSHPNYQSTPGVLLNKNVKAELGAHVVKSGGQASPLCLNEDNCGNSTTSTPTSVEKQRSLQCAQKENSKRFDSLKLKYPHTGRIQSLPSLNFMEKVDTWNMSQPENTSDALASCYQNVISHRKKAYSAVAISANNIFSMQNSSRNPKDYVAVPSGEKHSLENIHFHNKSSERFHPLTRSQSDNSVNVVRKDNSQADVVQPVNEAMQPLESNVSGVPENSSGGSLMHKLTTEVASGSVDKGAEGNSMGQSSYPNAFVSSERVSHLIKEDGSSSTDTQKKCDGLENQRLSHNLDVGHVRKDNFADTSPDNPNLPACSGALGSPGCSSVVTRHFFTGAEGDNIISVRATTVLETPEKEELNIEERIPIYLRNLGIDQSPGTILTPFVPRGPIREVEFSPSDLRTLKDSTDTLTRTIQQPQGELLAAVDVVQTSFNSDTSTASISIPMNSETDSDTFSPGELSSRFSLPFGAKPVSQCTMSCHKVEVTSPLSTQRETECSAVSKLAEPSQHLQTVPPDCHSNRESPVLVAKSVQGLLAKKESKDASGSSWGWTASSLAGVTDEKERGSQTSSAESEKNKGQESDCLLGSGALQEIRKLLAEAESIAGRWRDPVFSNASSRETQSSPVQIEKEDDTRDSKLVKDSIPQFQKVVSRAESMSQRSIQEGSITKPMDSCKDDLKWERSFDVGLCSREGMEMTREFRTGKSVGRSEPEGCSSITTDRNLPAVVAVAQSNANSELSTRRPSELEEPSPSEPRESVIDVPGSFQNKLSKADVAVNTAGGIRESSGSNSGDSLAAHVKNLLGNPLISLGNTADISGGFQSMMSKTSAAGSKAGGVQDSDGSSSGDSLAARVKNLLRGPSETLGSTTDAPGGFQSVLSKPSVAGSKAGGVQESDGSSSADSLAARVKSLLRNGSPLMPAVPVLKSANEEEWKARAWVKLKLASRSQEAVLDLNEEDRQRIEEIKAELLLSAKKSGQAKGTRSYSSEAASVYSYNQEADKVHSKASSDKRFRSDSQTQAFKTKELLMPSLQRVVPLYRAELSDSCLLKNTQLKSLSTAEPPACSQHQAIASSHSDCVGLQLPLQKQQDTRVMSSAAASGALTGKVPSPAQKKLSFPKCSEEMSKQITSITFSSRKRFQSPLSSVVHDGFSSGDDLDGIMPLEIDSATAEEQSRDKHHWERSETCPLSSPALAGSRSNEIAFTADKDRFCDVSDGNRAGADQETDFLSDRESVTVYADERQTLSAKNLDASSQNVTELGRHSARLLGLDCERRFSQSMKGLHEPRSISPYQKEKSSPTSHVQLRESLEGSDPAIQTDLPKDHGKLLEEEKCPSDAVPLIQKEDSGEQIGASQHSSPDEILCTVSPSSPIKKALSCVHITLSPKCNNSELHRDLNTENRMSLGDKLEVNSQPVPLKTPETLLEALPKLPTADLIPEDQRCSSFPVPSADPCSVFYSVPSTAGQELPLHGSEKPQAVSSEGHSLKNICNCTDPAKSRKSTSDATTQITTESPGKTTFSAEIYVNSQDIESSAHQSSTQKAKEFPQNTTSCLNRTSSFPRQGGQPLLLPYKPSGSTEMYYVPYLKAGTKISLLGTENSGPHDALPSGLPANVLGMQDNAPDSTAIKHKEGVYCKRAKPKLAWAEEQTIAQEGAPEGSHHLKSVNTTHSGFKSAQFYLHHPVSMREKYLLSHSEPSEDSSGVGHTGISSSTAVRNWKKAHRHRWVFSAHHRKDDKREFFPLTAEADYSKNEDLNVDTSLNNEAPREELLQPGGREAEQMAAYSQTSHLRENVVKDLPPRHRTHSAGSLDELWVKFLERQKRYQQHEFRHKGELTLVERLDRLARVLQNPVRYTLISAKAERNASEETDEVKEQEKRRLLEKSVAESTLEPHAARVKERPRINCHERSFVELRKNRSEEKVTIHMHEISEHQQYLDTSSDTCSERRLSKDLCTTVSSVISESDAVTQTDIETTTQTEVSSSVSTIDTARLVRAFGHRRVQLSPRLSQLYCTIRQQKSRSEKWDEEDSRVRGVKHPNVTSERHRKQKETQALDPALTSSGSWGPSSALSNKRRSRMLNKGIQAGDLEIVNGATKRNTRDFGVTFPTPRPIQPNQRPRDPWHRVHGIFGESDGTVTDHQAAGRKGISWFVQAEDLKFESRKENCSNSIPGPGSSWFEPFTTTKPWREPLREKNFQEQQCSKVTQPAERDAETRPTRPFVKLTLQEALALHRPDFIFRSGERVKHLKLVMEERRIQSELQSEQEELFNPLEKRKGYRNANHLLDDRGYLMKEKRRAIPKSEMVQRSKRIYEQLPEVQKKREEEKRKAEYNSNRLKAQLYKMKITNRVLGRKVPWN
ncbi:Alstrom syndrome protein 1 isoform X2 [Coturnix japonica]|nr:Alstrom syndrome protein 1 isoform X2 [Coturnix japonica]